MTYPRRRTVRRSATTISERMALRERSGGVCEICGVIRASNWHHRKNRSQGGGNTLSNALHLCGSGTTGCHGWITEHPTEAYENGWSVRSFADPAEVPVMRRGHWVLLGDSGSLVSTPGGAA